MKFINFLLQFSTAAGAATGGSGTTTTGSTTGAETTDFGFLGS